MIVLGLDLALWVLNVVWLTRDTRPPVWDMALHQTYALNFLPHAPGNSPTLLLTSRTGNYPPFVHLMIAVFYLLFHPGPHIAALANFPATVLLLWAIYALGSDLAGVSAARWACLLAALTPYLIWFSRETVLDYWLAAWVAASLVVLRKTESFQSHSRSLVFGLSCALGMLTKWFFGAFLFLPTLYVCIHSRIWRDRTRLIHLADASLVAGLVSGLWYLPNLPSLTRYFFENARIGAREGEPPVLSFQSFIYYLRLLEGYQLLGVLFLILALSVVAVWRKSLLRDLVFFLTAMCGGWLAMTLLRTKDPRFTMPLLGPLMILPGAWLQSWRSSWWTRTLKASLVAILALQAYAANFGIRWLPRRVVIAEGYTGSVRWDWNLFLQDYFEVLGQPRREDWKQEEILRTMVEDAGNRGARSELALIPDLPRFNASNFNLLARLRGLHVRVDHLVSEPHGVATFDGFDYVVMTERGQGMSWTTLTSRALNQIIVDDPATFRLIKLFLLPDGNCARLYYINRSSG